MLHEYSIGNISFNVSYKTPFLFQSSVSTKSNSGTSLRPFFMGKEHLLASKKKKFTLCNLHQIKAFNYNIRKASSSMVPAIPTKKEGPSSTTDSIRTHKKGLT